MKTLSKKRAEKMYNRLYKALQSGEYSPYGMDSRTMSISDPVRVHVMLCLADILNDKPLDRSKNWIL